MLDHTGHNDGNAPRPSSNSNSSFFGGGGGGSRLGGSRPPRGGGGGNGGGGGFMSMTDLRGSDSELNPRLIPPQMSLTFSRERLPICVRLDSKEMFRCNASLLVVFI